MDKQLYFLKEFINLLGYAPTTFSFSSSYHPQVSLGTSSTSPLRVALDVNYALAVGDTITFTLSSSNYPPVTTTNIVQLCTMRLQSTFGLPFLTKCTYSSGLYTLTMIQSISTGRYLVEVMLLFRDGSLTQGVTFTSTTALTTLTATIQSAYTDSIWIWPVPRKSLFPL